MSVVVITSSRQPSDSSRCSESACAARHVSTLTPVIWERLRCARRQLFPSLASAEFCAECRPITLSPRHAGPLGTCKTLKSNKFTRGVFRNYTRTLTFASGEISPAFSRYDINLKSLAYIVLFGKIIYLKDASIFCAIVFFRINLRKVT